MSQLLLKMEDDKPAPISESLNTARLWEAMSIRKVSVKQLSRSAGITVRKLYQWTRPSNYDIYPSETELKNLSEVLFFPVGFFTLGDETETWDNLDQISRQIAPRSPVPSGRK